MVVSSVPRLMAASRVFLYRAFTDPAGAATSTLPFLQIPRRLRPFNHHPRRLRPFDHNPRRLGPFNHNPRRLGPCRGGQEHAPHDLSLADPATRAVGGAADAAALCLKTPRCCY